MSEDEIRQALRALRQDEAPADSLVRVRAGVEARLAKGRGRRFWWWVPAAAVGAAALALSLMMVWAPDAPPPALPVVTVATPPPARLETVPPARTQAAAPRKPAPRAERQTPRNSGGQLRIETEDPSVVLIFVTDSGGED